MIVVWKRCPSYPDYEVSNTARVRRATAGRGTYPGREKQLYAYCDGHGYWKILVCLGNRRRRRGGRSRGSRRVRVARLVLEAHVRPARPGELARHLNDDPLNCWLDNLAWGTAKENMADAFRNGRRQRRSA